MFVSQTIEDANNQMLKLQSQPTLEGNQLLSRMIYVRWCWVDDRATQAEGPQNDECEKFHDVMSAIHNRASITG
ncbi:hypothetical protein E5676_scaffold27G00100 [Cucumis melo var. makuwa]|uniref:Uncharacterized protein n=1 Tax=Cucumis melo var. makuwa TaxID=1194695 RepID=A0A5D3DLQ0_CUCMM|nr:hypothetical protein E5676_scaffold27G00100 [Cucumis melo var. makuwa]